MSGRNTPKVIVTQENMRNDYRPAEHYGEVVFVTHKEWNPVRTSMRNDEIKHLARRALADYIPGVDYLLPSGSPVIAGLVFMLAREKGQTHQVLHWSNQEQDYRLVYIDL